MKKSVRYGKSLFAALLALFVLASCQTNSQGENQAEGSGTTDTAVEKAPDTDESITFIRLSDSGITANGEAVGSDPDKAVYTAHDIVYYEAGHDFTYGEGSEQDAHTAEEAASHTVLHIAQPGVYRLSGKLSKGQIAVDLGEDAKTDPKAVVTLILDGADITCDVAPAVIFYSVYECGQKDAEKASKDVDTSAAGARVILADGSENNISGSYVAKRYKPGSVVLNEEKTEVEDAKKLHKYDGAFYSKMSMTIGGGEKGSGVLNLRAENEGLDSELHLTVNGGSINIRSGNDGINTNEDGVSVTTINGGSLSITVTGETGEGDGIDSNGWLVINGGSVSANACAFSGDAGIDSDNGIHINGGTVIASGSMLDRIEDGGQTYAVFTFAQKQDGGKTVALNNSEGRTVWEGCPENGYSILICSSPALVEGTYTLWCDGRQMAGQKGEVGGFGGGRPGGMMRPENFELPEGMTPQERPEGFELPEGMTPQERPEGFERAEGMMPQERFENFELPEGMTPNGQRPEGMGKANGRDPSRGTDGTSSPLSPDFVIETGGNTFSGIAPLA